MRLVAGLALGVVRSPSLDSSGDRPVTGGATVPPPSGRLMGMMALRAGVLRA